MKERKKITLTNGYIYRGEILERENGFITIHDEYTNKNYRLNESQIMIEEEIRGRQQ